MLIVCSTYSFAEEDDYYLFSNYRLKLQETFLWQSNSLASVKYDGELTTYREASFGFKIISDSELYFSKNYPLALLERTTFPIIELDDSRIEFGFGVSYGRKFDGHL